MLRLHNFFRSSTSTRVRIALNIKDVPFEYVPYVLREGQTRTHEYLKMNPSGLVPTLERPDGSFLTQSLAIIEWLEELYPERPLLPANPDDRARVRALSYMIACEIHPLNNLRVLGYINEAFSADEDDQKKWFTHWAETTLRALEATLEESDVTGTFCVGDQPSMADICLYAQIWNNRRFEVNTESLPNITRIFAALDELPAFKSAAPPLQPDAT